jgi:hypothetical protein
MEAMLDLSRFVENFSEPAALPYEVTRWPQAACLRGLSGCCSYALGVSSGAVREPVAILGAVSTYAAQKDADGF